MSRQLEELNDILITLDGMAVAILIRDPKPSQSELKAMRRLLLSALNTYNVLEEAELSRR